jgi:hypothetical protein
MSREFNRARPSCKSGGILLALCVLGYASAAPPAAPAAASTATLSERHPGDAGMGSDPAVVLYENFEEGSVAAVSARYDTVKHSAGMALVDDHPPNGPGGHAMKLTAGGSGPGTVLFKSFGAGYDELYFRYYIKYLGSGPFGHSGLYLGGYNPPLP